MSKQAERYTSAKLNVEHLKTRHHSIAPKSGFSMVEMMVVVGIIGILIGAGAMSYVSQINNSRIDTALRILNTNMRQAKQSAISMRQVRRVVIDAGELSGFGKEISGTRMRPAKVWIEGKYCEQWDFDDFAYCDEGGQNVLNAYPLSDEVVLPDAVSISDVGGHFPGIDDTPEIFYIEFSPRGAVQKVYFEGMENETNYNEIAPIIHLSRIGEVFKIGATSNMYESINFNRIPEWGEDGADVRYKAQTLEVIRLTGRTRMYDYGIMSPWPMDELRTD